MSEVVYADPDLEVSAMCNRNHVDRAWLYEQGIPDTQYEPARQEAKSGPVIHIFEGTEKEVPEERKILKAPSIETVKRILGALARVGAGAVFLCGVADGLIDTTYGLTLTIVCIGWGLLHLLKVVAHG